MSELDPWGYDLIIATLDDEDVHPMLYRMTGEGMYEQHPCPTGRLLAHVPPDILKKAHAIRAYNHQKEAQS